MLFVQVGEAISNSAVYSVTVHIPFAFRSYFNCLCLVFIAMLSNIEPVTVTIAVAA